ncbi:unnamed protein product (macronuclear) [Paramecium tetraurelia]|uniref:Uncharacterized protein n=1 Tax=Paramecium tetraurelia TaxID=5888 RepID=A0BYL0_PARTE|nr:uncharacterized protein GSPATT00033480001 [Paramecium tetraurelia]CAK63627.1 unnamed protein product [Paramecium tetraurelia]|eukprot:XP_001431025.1 hypothetical protein (macronuclear) [Paramecium tetraurelia strain d4-2]
MGGMIQKFKNLYARPNEDLPTKDDPKFHKTIENQNMHDKQLESLQSLEFKEIDKLKRNFSNTAVRMIQMMQGKQHDTQPYQTQKLQIRKTISELN